MSVLPIPMRLEIVPGQVDLFDQESWVWVNITGDLRKSESIKISNGRRAEGAQVDPAEMSLMLNNRHGKYSRHNPNSPYYAQLSLETPVRLSVDVPGELTGVASVADTFTRDDDPNGWGIAETGGQWSAPFLEDGETFSIVSQRGVLTIDKDVITDPDLARLAHIFQHSFLVDGDILVSISPAQLSSGASVRARIGYQGVNSMWLTVNFRSDAGITVGLGHDQPTTDLINLDSGLTYAANDWFRVRINVRAGQHRVRIWRVGDPEPITWNIDLHHELEDIQPWISVQGGIFNNNTNTGLIVLRYDDIEATAVSNAVRFSGFVNEWPPRWDQSGNDAFVPIEASGIIRRLEQGLSALDSTLTRQVPTMPEVVGYWPMEDDVDSDSFASPIPGVRPMSVDGDVDLASQSAPGGSKPLPLFKLGSTFAGRLASHTVDGAWRVDWLFRMNEAPSTRRQAMAIRTSSSTATEWEIWVNSTEIRVDAYDVDRTLVYTGAVTIHADFFGDWVRFQFRVIQEGSQIRWRLAVLRPNGATPITFHSVTDLVVGTRTIGVVNRAGVGRLGPTAPTDRSWGHVTVSRADVDPFSGIADDGYRDERAVPRIQRLALEEGIPIKIVGDPEDSMPMGPQRPDTVLNLWRDCAAADGGFLYEEGFGLAYQTRRARYNQPVSLTLDQAAGELARAPEPIDDDRFARNDVTVKRIEGTSFRAVIEDVARRDEQIELNVARDSLLADIAWWRINLATVDEMRWPSIPFLLNRPANEHLVGAWLLLALGNRVEIPLGYGQLPGVDVDVLIDGWQEIIDEHRWAITLNTSPAAPWRVFQVEHPEFGRLDTDGSTLVAAIGEADTSASVASDAGPVWINSTDHAQHFPFRIVVAGEVWEVTAISGSTSPQTFTMTRSVNGVVKAHAAGTAIRIFPQIHWSL